MSRGQQQRRLLPAYLATGSSSIPVPSTLDSLTALRATDVPLASYHTAVHQRLVQLLADGALTVVEVAGYLGLPVSVSLVLAEQLVSDGRLKATVPLPGALAPSSAGRPSKEVMEEVLSGLRALLV
ncbi:DUF742 domain-containing protein [Kitasatospora sp. GAS204B]|uniref:DUF742 domain-containing protein n=1 Tax=unclassified Kitasatospora TaxID=2633591 RepID=UPI00247497C2|nr:DUF742 domain-containing protein [Kitasatospora sp. GAS204B]MDH6118846.1 hypothetical protein [Kitasatospora sp. GAS204B]